MLRFGSSQPISGKLDQMLEKQNLTVEELFQVQHIIGDIKLKIQKFVEYLKQHKDFTLNILKLVLETPLQEIQSKNIKKIVFNAVQFITCDEDYLADLFFPLEVENTSQIPQIINEEIHQNTNQTSNSKTLIKTKKQPIFQKYELIKLAFNILRNPTSNITSLTYFSKLFSFLIRKDSQQPLAFLSSNPQYSLLIENNVCYDSIANLLVQIVTTEDKNREYKYQQYKTQVFNHLLDNLFSHITNQQYFQGAMNFVQEVLNNTKQSYYEYFEDFKRCANVLVSQKILKKFYNLMMENNSQSLKNSCTYLHMIVKRLNAQNQDQNYYDYSNDKQPTMLFQTDFFYEKINQLIQNGIKILNKKEIDGLTRVLYLNLVVQLMKNSKFTNCNIEVEKCLEFLLMAIRQSSYKGLIKNNLYEIIYLIVDNSSPEKLDNFVNKRQCNVFKDYLSSIKNEIQKITNMNENICFEYKIILLLKTKAHKIEFLSKQNQQYLRILEQRYGAILAPSQDKLTIKSNLAYVYKNNKEKITEINNNQQATQQQNQTNTKKTTVPTLLLPFKLDLKIDEQEDPIIEQEKVQRVEITSPKRPNIGFMGIPSPRSHEIRLIGLDVISEDSVKSEKAQDQENIKKKEQKVEKLQKDKINIIRQGELQFYIRHKILS